ncbi:MAG: hypothetical protein RIT25_3001 [Planctomycetota bacterium]|jgi:hypothetical protein
MSVIPILLLCSLVLVAGSVVLFVLSARQGDCHQSERLCLLPLEDDAPRGTDAAQPPQESTHPREIPCKKST